MRLLTVIIACLPTLLFAQDREVDVELVLAVDVSRSMSEAELDIQRRGYAEALESDDVIDAIQNGLLGQVAITYVEWAGEYSQRVVAPWAMVSNRAEAARLAGRIRASTNPGLRRTSISGALLFSLDAFENNGFQGLRRVIDVSGDGPNNQGRPVLRAREKVLARGVTINGLPLMTKDALSLMWGIADLDLYYENCVIGGPGSFVLPVHEWDEFAKAVKRKLVLEIAQAPLPVVPVQYSPPVDYDCLIGEKMWEQNRTFFDIP